MSKRTASYVFSLLFALPIAGAISQVLPGVEVAQAANRVSYEIRPEQSRYPRETDVRIVIRVVGEHGRPVANTPILVRETFFNEQTRRTNERTIAEGTTNHEGRFSINYQVPKETFKDKVTLNFVNPVNGGGATAFVIPIGR